MTSRAPDPAKPRWDRRLCCLLIVLACGPHGLAIAQDTDNDSQVRWFALTSLESFVEVRSEFDFDRVDQDGGARSGRRQENTDFTIEESIGFDLRGYAIRPDVITFGGDLSFGLTQSRYRENVDGDVDVDPDSGRLLRYHLRAEILPGSTMSGSVEAAHDDDRISRRFQPTLLVDRTSFGANWSYAHETLPMSLSYRYLDTTRDGNRDPRDDESLIESTLQYSLDWGPTDDHKLSLDYEYGSTDQRYQGIGETYRTDRSVLRTDHELRFGKESRHGLRTVMRWQEESGDLARDLFEIGPQLTLKHSDNLETRYLYQFNHERYEGLDIATNRVDWQLTHQLFSNLTTNVDVFALHEDTDTTQYGASVDWQYRKHNRWGDFEANLALAWDEVRARADDGQRIVRDEAVTFRDPVTPTLRNQDVIETSIVVTDVSNRRVLRRNVDYQIRRVGTNTLLVRVPTGDIADGDTVLVDYRFETPSDGTIDTMRVDFTVEQQFTNGLTPYYRFSFRDQDVDRSTGFPPSADRTNHHRLGADYEFGKFRIGAELEIFDDTVEPYDAFHLRGRWSVLQRPTQQLSAAARLSRLDFEGGEDDRDVTLLELELDHRMNMGERLSAFNRLAFRFEDDSKEGLTHYWDVSTGLEYVWGRLSGEMTFEYDHLGLPGSDQDDFGVFFRLRRSFGDVLAKR